MVKFPEHSISPLRIGAEAPQYLLRGRTHSLRETEMITLKKWKKKKKTQNSFLWFFYKFKKKTTTKKQSLVSTHSQKKELFLSHNDELTKWLTSSVRTSTSLFPAQSSSWVYRWSYFILWDLPPTHPFPKQNSWTGLRTIPKKKEANLKQP